MAERPRSYTTVEAARLLGISPASVQRWVDAGHLKAWKTLGGHRRIDADSADAFVAAQGAGLPLPSRVAEPAQAAAAQPFTVLVVDDDPIARELLETQVRIAQPGAQLLLAENGFQALLTVGRARPDVVITDMVMPHMNGLEMIRELQGQAEPPCIVAVSSQSRESLERLGRLPEAVQLLAKPVDQALLAEALRQAATGRSPRR
ncbi:response regulator [Pelomonas sp. SE-A7]|uniref:response regulator n=1 Tax=Pelomonas sp. SE-A7 TaxID=3054953 RepID=UPI00259C788B|nr:response regulator [Pelomonas sp. SE-A7]MDM4767890.1 response regulator [Pelomonas sp. SE-A7]